MAHHVAGLGIHRHNLVGVADVAAVGNLAFGDQTRQFICVAMHDKADVAIARRRISDTSDHRFRTVIAAHRVD